MLSTEDAEAVLAKVAGLRLEVARLQPDAQAIGHDAGHHVLMIASYLEDLFLSGLQAHGDAVLAAHLATTRQNADA
jgi:hypothetical protein